MKILPAPKDQLTIEDAITRKGDFDWPPTTNPNYGFGNETLWLYAQVTNASSTEQWVLDVNYAQNDEVDLYVVKDGEIIAESHQGKSQGLQLYRLPTLEARLPRAVPLDIYLRVRSIGEARIVPVTLMSEQQHHRATTIDNLLWGGFYGALLILLLYNTSLLAKTRDLSLLAYCLYLISVICWQLLWGGHLQLFASGPNIQWLLQHTDILSSLMTITAAFFTLTFLDLGERATQVARIIYTLVTLSLVHILLSSTDFIPPDLRSGISLALGTAGIIAFLYAGYVSYVDRFNPAKYFIVAWSILLTAALVGVFSLLGLLPSNATTTYCFQVGVFIEAGLFSFALMDKLNTRMSNLVQDATDDLQNNLEIIEEKNAHLDIARREAIQASAVKSQFLANMSHEIRTPLNAILGFTDELDQSPLTREQKEHVTIIKTSAQNLVNIINDVLDFSKIEAGKLELQQTIFQPTQMLEDVARLMAQSAFNKNLTFICDWQALPEKLLGDEIRIRQILINLVGNAIKFTHQGHVRLAASGQQIDETRYRMDFIVEDTGIGIGENEQEKLFKAFSQLESSRDRHYQGTGLGLSICQELVRLMKGRIDFDSQLHGGSTFSISLTLNLMSHHLSQPDHDYWQLQHFLLYDPYPPSRRATAALLKSLGGRVTSADSWQFARHQHHADYLLINPYGNLSLGELRQHLADFPHIPDNKLIMVNDARQADLYQPLGFRALQKPLTTERLEALRDPVPLTSPVVADEPGLPKARVLAVDDMPMNLRLIETWLATTAVELTLSYTGSDAVELCEQQEFDLILMDVQMPGMDGITATRAIRKTRLNQGTPVIAVTAHAFREEQQQLLASGMDDFLSKPISRDQLFGLLKQWCAGEEPDSSNVDWLQALQQADNDEAIARQLLAAFVAQLPEITGAMQQAAEQDDNEELARLLHKLHGACCYTGVPQLRSLCEEMETLAKQNQFEQVHGRLESLWQLCDQVQQDSQAWLEPTA
ncbi:hybrid sensor histidine kinase/response regulator [Saliniradius amylolyticus]|uniref:hybrid sensor histidine kinase/response regulator n=1 Tax=Saliniradius amylolyticus TaxID=2183582 RepID=UPI0013A53151|nr:hybrid sensor histidine kinase/response regulator [Saliniradius amylolyticus]